MNQVLNSYTKGKVLLNPNFGRVNDLVQTWAEKGNLYYNREEKRKCDHQQLNKFAARLFPLANEEELLNITKLFLVLFCLDDRADKLKGQVRVNFWKEQLDLFSYHQKKAGLGACCIDEVYYELHWGWFRRRTTENRLGLHLIKHIRKFLKAGMWEAKNLARSKPPTIIKYIYQLKHCSGAGIALELLAYLEKSNLPPELFHHKELAPLFQTIIELICLSNDLTSYEKEDKVGDFHNLVILQEMQYHIARPIALDRINKRVQFLKEVYSNQTQNILQIDIGHYYQKSKLITGINSLLNGMEKWVKDDTGRYNL